MSLPKELSGWRFWLLFAGALVVTSVIWVLSFLPQIRKRRDSK